MIIWEYTYLYYIILHYNIYDVISFTLPFSKINRWQFVILSYELRVTNIDYLLLFMYYYYNKYPTKWILMIVFTVFNKSLQEPSAPIYNNNSISVVSRLCNDLQLNYLYFMFILYLIIHRSVFMKFSIVIIIGGKEFVFGSRFFFFYMCACVSNSVEW